MAVPATAASSSPTWGHRIALPKDTSCLTALSDGLVVAGFAEGVQIVSWGVAAVKFAEARSLGFKTTCLISMGSQSLAAGDDAGHVRIWHWRRGVLKLTLKLDVHTSAVRTLANGGDVILTGSDDGLVRQLNALENFTCSDFYSAGVAVCSVTTRLKNVLIGCKNGHILEVARWMPETRLLRRMDLGTPVLILDADPSGGRILAGGGERLAVWIDAPGGCRRNSNVGPDDPSVVPTAMWKRDGIQAAVLLPGGGLEDFVMVGASGLTRGPRQNAWGHNEDAKSKSETPRPAAALVRGITPASFFFAAPDEKNGSTMALFELQLPPEPSEAVDIVESNPALTSEQSVDKVEMVVTDLVVSSTADEGMSAEMIVDSRDTPNSQNPQTLAMTVTSRTTATTSEPAEATEDKATKTRTSKFYTPTAASRARGAVGA